MQRAVPANSISTERPQALLALQAAWATWRALSVERFRAWGLGGYTLIALVQPIFTASVAALIYRGARPDLLDYAVVGVAANAFVINSIFYIGEILDRERIKGTLVCLFLAPCPRLSWLVGLATVGLSETAAIATSGLLYGRFALGVHYHPNIPALLLTLPLFVLSLWGIGFVFSAIWLCIKKANPFSNLVSPFLMLLGGVYYPVALLPAWLRYPARALPHGYAMQALADATLYHAGIRDLAPQLLPLAGFAVALPVIGIRTFGWVERLVRQRGELDLY
jgi:ABC-2 type transport system permease protein